MDNSESLQKALNLSIERSARMVMNYEVEIANLNIQILQANARIEELVKKVNEASKNAPKTATPKE